MKKILIKVVKNLFIIVTFLTLTVFAFRAFMSEGKMPSKNQAIAIQADALKLIEQYNNDPSQKIILPESIKQLKPRYHSVDEIGLLLIFKSMFVESFGYYFCKENETPPKDVAVFCDEAAPGVYEYFNPG